MTRLQINIALWDLSHRAEQKAGYHYSWHLAGTDRYGIKPEKCEELPQAQHYARLARRIADWASE